MSGATTRGAINFHVLGPLLALLALIAPRIENLCVAGDNTGFGRMAREYFRDHLAPDNERADAFTASLDGSGIEILDMQHGNWNRDDAFNVMQDYPSKYEQIDAVRAADDHMTIGVMEAIAQARRKDEMRIVGAAGMKETIKRIMDGDPQLPGDVSHPPAQISTAIELTAPGLGSSTPVSGRFIIVPALITPRNAARFHFPDSPF